MPLEPRRCIYAWRSSSGYQWANYVTMRVPLTIANFVFTTLMRCVYRSGWKKNLSLLKGVGKASTKSQSIAVATLRLTSQDSSEVGERKLEARPVWRMLSC